MRANAKPKSAVIPSAECLYAMRQNPFLLDRTMLYMGLEGKA
jgi:hypothetical protein